MVDREICLATLSLRMKIWKFQVWFFIQAAVSDGKDEGLYKEVGSGVLFIFKRGN